ncbi:carbohydrate esterase family 4 protein [Tulasnella calospora MUT 4182]|uniref:Carbohydrate esterase family 4 protein n=1 Tax=Tulasnella calospora MUT 4182 TaxID=1051891 RepID=A0A0C3QHC0_9AGAM|nr:carbohydrate esterase family 4 protein [Tulasnella calospora MUT 4182]
MAAKTSNQQTTTFMKPFPGAHQSNSLGRDPSPARPPPPLQPQPGQVPKPQ